MPGRVLKTKKSAWIPDVTKDTNFPRAKGAQDIGVKAAFAFPVIADSADSEVIAVLEFFHPLAIEPDEQILESVENIGKQVGKVMEVIKHIQFKDQIRKVKQMQKAVASTEELLRNSIRPEKLDDYIKWIETIWKEVLRLNSYIHCIKRITEFPFGLLQHNPSPFWTCVVDSMFESSITLIYKIWIDDDDRTLTLERFKDEIVCRFIKEEYKKQLIEDWDVQFEKIDPNIKNRIRDLRNNIVHFNLNRALNIDVSDEDIKKREIFLTEICEFRENIITLLLMLNLGHVFRRTDHGTDFYDLNYPLADAKNPSDIEILLDTIAEKSDVMHMPEKEPGLWTEYRRLMHDDSQIKTLNKYREKFDLLPVE